LFKKMIKRVFYNLSIKSKLLISFSNGNLLVSSNPKIETLPKNIGKFKRYDIKSFNFTIGSVYIEKDGKYINSLILGYIKKTLSIFGFILIISTFLSVLISKRILKRIGFIKENLSYVSKKEWSKVKKARFKENDELTEVLNAFYNMSKELQSYISEIYELKRFYSEILFHIDSIVIVCNRNGKVLFSNKEIKEKNINQIFLNKEDFVRINKKIERINSCTCETKLKIMGKEIWALINVTRYEEKFIYTISDITEIKKLQEQYNTAQRLSAIGDIGASLAHELKNMLLPLNIYLEDIKNLDGEDIENTKNILKRMNKLIKSFLNFTKPPIESKGEPINISVLLEEILFILSPIFQKNMIVLNKHIEKDIYYTINQNAFEIIAINLIKNAIEASSKGSIICIILQKNRNENCIEFMVKDYGRGIPNEIRDKIFEPFVSTKKDGTGLGLSTVYRIVYENNGEIFVNTGNFGTTFTVKFYLEDRDEVINSRGPNRSLKIIGKVS